MTIEEKGNAAPPERAGSGSQALESRSIDIHGENAARSLLAWLAIKCRRIQVPEDTEDRPLRALHSIDRIIISWDGLGPPGHPIPLPLNNQPPSRVLTQEYQIRIGIKIKIKFKNNWIFFSLCDYG